MASDSGASDSGRSDDGRSDDGDIESSHPSEDFKVGDFDRSSGFFTPVWESKKRIRSETPIPSSAPGLGGRVVIKPAAPPAGAKARPSTASALPKAGRMGKKPSKTRAKASATDTGSAQLRQATGAQAGSAVASAVAKGQPLAPSPVLKASVDVFDQTGPELPPEAFFDATPEFRVPELPVKTAEHTTQYRSLKASAAATRVHDQLKARLRSDDDRDAHDTFTDLKAMPAASTDPLSVHVLRQFRRTIRLSTPLPEPVRSMIVRARSN